MFCIHNFIRWVTFSTRCLSAVPLGSTNTFFFSVQSFYLHHLSSFWKYFLPTNSGKPVLTFNYIQTIVNDAIVAGIGSITVVIVAVVGYAFFFSSCLRDVVSHTMTCWFVNLLLQINYDFHPWHEFTCNKFSFVVNVQRFKNMKKKILEVFLLHFYSCFDLKAHKDDFPSSAIL